MKISKQSILFKALSVWIIACFTLLSVVPSDALAQGVLGLPAAGTMVALSPGFVPVILRGLKVYPEDPFKFDFIVDSGNSGLTGETLKKESEKIIRYFLASLTLPEDDLWVNLSPYEQNRIITDSLGATEMGRDMLSQDYLLKQITASLLYPEDELGKKFWKRIYEKAYLEFGTTTIPVNTFNKVWIVPDKAVVYEDGDRAFVVENKLKVMLEEDYLALEKGNQRQRISDNKPDTNSLASQVLREVVLPELEKEVNEGKNFALLRQIVSSWVLAVWFKNNLRSSLLNRAYSDQRKVAGIDLEEKNVKETIYQQYLEAYKKGVYDLVKVEYDQHSRRHVPRKYFSGGLEFSSSAIQTFNRNSISSPMARSFMDTIRRFVYKGTIFALVVSMIGITNPQNISGMNYMMHGTPMTQQLSIPQYILPHIPKIERAIIDLELAMGGFLLEKDLSKYVFLPIESRPGKIFGYSAEIPYYSADKSFGEITFDIRGRDGNIRFFLNERMLPKNPRQRIRLIEEQLITPETWNHFLDQLKKHENKMDGANFDLNRIELLKNNPPQRDETFVLPLTNNIGQHIANINGVVRYRSNKGVFFHFKLSASDIADYTRDPEGEKEKLKEMSLGFLKLLWDSAVLSIAAVVEIPFFYQLGWVEERADKIVGVGGTGDSEQGSWNRLYGNAAQLGKRNFRQHRNHKSSHKTTPRKLRQLVTDAAPTPVFMNNLRHNFKTPDPAVVSFEQVEYFINSLFLGTPTQLPQDPNAPVAFHFENGYFSVILNPQKNGIPADHVSVNFPKYAFRLTADDIKIEKGDYVLGLDVSYSMTEEMILQLIEGIEDALELFEDNQELKIYFINSEKRGERGPDAILTKNEILTMIQNGTFKKFLEDQRTLTTPIPENLRKIFRNEENAKIILITDGHTDYDPSLIPASEERQAEEFKRLLEEFGNEVFQNIFIHQIPAPKDFYFVADTLLGSMVAEGARRNLGGYAQIAETIQENFLSYASVSVPAAHYENPSFKVINNQGGNIFQTGPALDQESPAEGYEIKTLKMGPNGELAILLPKDTKIVNGEVIFRPQKFAFKSTNPNRAFSLIFDVSGSMADFIKTVRDDLLQVARQNDIRSLVLFSSGDAYLVHNNGLPLDAKTLEEELMDLKKIDGFTETVQIKENIEFILDQIVPNLSNKELFVLCASDFIKTAGRTEALNDNIQSLRKKQVRFIPMIPNRSLFDFINLLNDPKKNSAAVDFENMHSDDVLSFLKLAIATTQPGDEFPIHGFGTKAYQALMHYFVINSLANGRIRQDHSNVKEIRVVTQGPGGLNRIRYIIDTSGLGETRIDDLEAYEYNRSKDEITNMLIDFVEAMIGQENIQGLEYDSAIKKYREHLENNYDVMVDQMNNTGETPIEIFVDYFLGDRYEQQLKNSERIDQSGNLHIVQDGVEYILQNEGYEEAKVNETNLELIRQRPSFIEGYKLDEKFHSFNDKDSVLYQIHGLVRNAVYEGKSFSILFDGKFYPIVSKSSSVLNVTPAPDPMNPTGGIDLNIRQLQIETRGRGMDIILPQYLPDFDPALIPGFIPAVINIIPITNISEIWKDPDQDEPLAKGF